MNGEVLLLALVTSVACALPGVFLVLRRMALMSDAISHALLPGIVVAFLLTQDLASPLMLVFAVLTGLVTVSLTELLSRTKLIAEDAAIGLVFPFLFSVGVLLVALYTGNIHLDMDAVMLGELAFAPFDRLVWDGLDLGPKGLWLMSAILAVNILFLTLFFKELKLSAFDPGLAAVLGFSPLVLHYGLMLLVSVTAVGAFDSVGSILVVALMIAPGSTAYLLTHRLGPLLVLSAVIAMAASALGFAAAILTDTSIAGAIAVANGIFFLAAFLFAPQRGVLWQWQSREAKRLELGIRLLLVHLLHHEGGAEGPRECRRDHLLDHINWSQGFADRVVNAALQKRLVLEKGALLVLTAAGLEQAKAAMTE